MADYPSFSSPTKASLAKAKPVSQIRERLQQVSSKMVDLTYDQQATTEQLNSNFGALSKQIKILKNAFTELGDNFLNELFKMRGELTETIDANEAAELERHEATCKKI